MISWSNLCWYDAFYIDCYSSYILYLQICYSTLLLLHPIWPLLLSVVVLAISVSNYSADMCLIKYFSLLIGKILAHLVCAITIWPNSSLFMLIFVLVNSICYITIIVFVISLVSGVFEISFTLECFYCGLIHCLPPQFWCFCFDCLLLVSLFTHVQILRLPNDVQCCKFCALCWGLIQVCCILIFVLH